MAAIGEALEAAGSSAPLDALHARELEELSATLDDEKERAESGMQAKLAANRAKKLADLADKQISYRARLRGLITVNLLLRSPLTAAVLQKVPCLCFQREQKLHLLTLLLIR
jgi:hypothetical protein